MLVQDAARMHVLAKATDCERCRWGSVEQLKRSGDALPYVDRLFPEGHF
jgi:hypothetical protein